MKQSYITALTDALNKNIDVDSVLKRTEQLMIKKGHSRLWPAVLRGVIREMERRNQINTPQVIVATKTAETVLKDERLTKALTSVGADALSTYNVSVDNTLIGGFVVRYRDRMLDVSYKRALTDLYHKVTKS